MLVRADASTLRAGQEVDRQTVKAETGLRLGADTLDAFAPEDEPQSDVVGIGEGPPSIAAGGSDHQLVSELIVGDLAT